MIILGILIAVFVFASVFAVSILLSMLLIVLGIAMICGISNLKGLSVFGIVFGILFVILGVVTLINPTLIPTIIPYVIGGGALVWGIINLISGIAGSGVNRGVSIAVGILGIIFGILLFCCIFNVASVFGPEIAGFLTYSVLVQVAGIFLVISGILTLIEGCCMPSNPKTE